MTAVLYAALAGQAGPSSDLYTVDDTTAVMTSIGDIGDPISGMAVDPTDGTIYGTTASANPTNFGTLVTIDTSTGAETIIGAFTDGPGGPSVAFHELAFRSDGQLFGLCNSSPGLWTIDKATAIATAVNSISGDRIDGGAFDFDASDVLWLVGGFVNGVAGGAPVIGTIDTTTGMFTQTGSPSDNNYIHSGKFDSTGLMWASWQGEVRTTMGTDLITVDIATGTVTEVASFSTPSVGGLCWAGTATPVLRARFTGTPLGGYAPLTVAFTDHSTPGPSGPITARLWDFGDGNFSSGTNPTHAYTSPGSYTVQLTVTGTSPDGTDTHTVAHYINVLGPKTTLLAALAGSHTTSDLYTVDPATAVMTSIGPTGFALTGIAQDPTTGIVYGSTSRRSSASPRSLVTIDPNTGAGVLVGSFNRGTNSTAHDIAFDSSGQLWGWDSSSGALWKINKATGDATVVASAGGTYAGGLDFDSGGTLWKVAYNPDEIGTVNTSTGAVTPLVTTSDGNYWHSGKFDGSDVFWASGPGGGGAAGLDLATIDQGSGLVTVIGAFSVPGVGGLAWIAAPSTTPDFTVALVPSSINVSDGVNTLVHLNTTALHGDTETITLSATAPAGFTVTFPANPITAGDFGVEIDIAVGSPAVGTYSIVIHCVGTDNSHDVTLTVHVLTIVPGFHLAS